MIMCWLGSAMGDTREDHKLEDLKYMSKVRHDFLKAGVKWQGHGGVLHSLEF